MWEELCNCGIPAEWTTTWIVPSKLWLCSKPQRLKASCSWHECQMLWLQTTGSHWRSWRTCIGIKHTDGFQKRAGAQWKSREWALLNHPGMVPGTTLDLTLPEPYLNVNSELEELLLTSVLLFQLEWLECKEVLILQGGQSNWLNCHFESQFWSTSHSRKLGTHCNCPLKRTIPWCSQVSFFVISEHKDLKLPHPPAFSHKDSCDVLWSTIGRKGVSNTTLFM